jgi:ribosomal protein S27AE
MLCAVLGQGYCFIAAAIALPSPPVGEGEKHDGGNLMELRTASPRKSVQTRLLNLCAQCGETIFLPEWSEYLDRHRVRHLWECEECGYKFETLVSFPDP